MRHWVGGTVNSADTLHVNFLQIMAKTKYNLTLSSIYIHLYNIMTLHHDLHFKTIHQ